MNWAAEHDIRELQSTNDNVQCNVADSASRREVLQQSWRTDCMSATLLSRSCQFYHSSRVLCGQGT